MTGVTLARYSPNRESTNAAAIPEIYVSEVLIWGMDGRNVPGCRDEDFFAAE